MELKERVLGCMVGGACGDALGYGVEFLRLRENKGKIRKRRDYRIIGKSCKDLRRYADVAFYCKRSALWIYDGY